MARAGLAALHREQPLEEFPVVHEGQPEVFGRRLLTASPLFFEARAGVGEPSRELVDQIGDQYVGFLDAFLGIIDEGRLHAGPSRTQFRELVVGEEGFRC
jgi:hypothetical protein